MLARPGLARSVAGPGIRGSRGSVPWPVFAPD